jgi:hypothetical protein
METAIHVQPQSAADGAVLAALPSILASGLLAISPWADSLAQRLLSNSRVAQKNCSAQQSLPACGRLYFEGDAMQSQLHWLLSLALLLPLAGLVGCEDSEQEQIDDQQEDVEEVREEMEQSREEIQDAQAELQEEEAEIAEEAREETFEEREAVEEAQDKLQRQQNQLQKEQADVQDELTDPEPTE